MEIRYFHGFGSSKMHLLKPLEDLEGHYNSLCNRWWTTKPARTEQLPSLPVCSLCRREAKRRGIEVKGGL